MPIKSEHFLPTLRDREALTDPYGEYRAALRDKFAAQCIANSCLHLASYLDEADIDTAKKEAELIATSAYILADAMLIARKAGA